MKKSIIVIVSFALMSLTSCMKKDKMKDTLYPNNCPYHHSNCTQPCGNTTDTTNIGEPASTVAYEQYGGFYSMYMDESNRLNPVLTQHGDSIYFMYSIATFVSDSTKSVQPFVDVTYLRDGQTFTLQLYANDFVPYGNTWFQNMPYVHKNYWIRYMRSALSLKHFNIKPSDVKKFSYHSVFNVKGYNQDTTQVEWRYPGSAVHQVFN